jgi:hypothetical protein
VGSGEECMAHRHGDGGDHREVRLVSSISGALMVSKARRRAIGTAMRAMNAEPMLTQGWARW